MPTSHRQRCTISISQSILTPSAAKTSAAPDFDEKARLPCFATGTPQPATTSALAVEMLNVPELSPPVPTVSIVPGGASIASALARMMRAAPVISSTLSPRTRSAIKKAPICDGVALPLMMISKAASASLSLRRRPAATAASSGLRSLIGTLIGSCSGTRCLAALTKSALIGLNSSRGACLKLGAGLYQPRQSEGNRGRRCCPFVCRDVPQPAQRRFDVGLSRMGADLRDPGLHWRCGPPGLEHRPGAAGRPLRQPHRGRCPVPEPRLVPCRRDCPLGLYRGASGRCRRPDPARCTGRDLTGRLP